MERHPKSYDSDRGIQQRDGICKTTVTKPSRSKRHASQLARLEQEVISTHMKYNCSREIMTGINPDDVNVSIVPMNDIQSYHYESDPPSNHTDNDVIAAIKHKTFERIQTSVAVLHDRKMMIDAKIQKHVDLNSLPKTNRRSTVTTLEQELDDIDSLILRKMKEQFNPMNCTNIIHNSSEEECGDIETAAATTCSFLVGLNELPERTGSTGMERDNDDETTTGKLPVGSNHSNIQLNDDSYEYDGMDDEELVVAVDVDDHDNNNNNNTHSELPSAIQYDPNMKPYLHITRRFVVFVSLMGIAIVTGAVGACIGMVLIHRHESAARNIPAYPRTNDIRDIVELFIPNEQLDDVSSPYRKALDWMMSVDPSTLPSNDSKLVQRYLVAYLYFATSTKRSWTTGCAPATIINSTTTITTTTEDDGQCTFHRIAATVDDDEDVYDDNTIQVAAFRWLSDSDECQWAGIHCDRSLYLRSVDLGGFGLSGTFPHGITKFPYLEEIHMGHGQLEGALPANIALMKHLIHIDLQNNHFTGTIPHDWYHVSRSFQHINVRRNHIRGTIPPSISHWTDVKRFHVGDNALHGRIPTEIGHMTNVQELVLYQNQLNGTIPTTIGQIPALWECSLFQNQLTGTIPTELGTLTTLVDVRLDDNEFEGSIPIEFWKLINLWRIQLNGNQLNGTISRRIGQLQTLKYLYLNDNQFSGTIPSIIGSSSASNRLREVSVKGNDFIGTMPASICHKVASQQIMILVADCDGSYSSSRSSGNTSTSDGEIADRFVCPHGCCTSCCGSDGTTCVDQMHS